MSQAGESLEEHQLLLGSPAKPELCLPTGLPLLRGNPLEALFPLAGRGRCDGPFRLYEDEHFQLGLASCPVEADLAGLSFRLYSQICEWVSPSKLCRIWNYVPGINAIGADGMENYRSFCKGRALAFEEGLGRQFERRLPAASAVGTDGNQLTVLFAASRSGDCSHFENPLQTPAYHYPSEYGPRPPSFARATLIRDRARGSLRHAFISGTAAIRGHRSLAAGDNSAQLAITVENLRALGEHCGLGADLLVNQTTERHLKVYLRHEEDLASTQQYLQSHLLGGNDQVSYLRSDICRSELNVEIELSLLHI